MAYIVGRQIQDGTVQRVDMDISTPGQSVIVKINNGANGILVDTSSGGDSGTGEVVLKADRNYFDNHYPAFDISRPQNTVFAGPTSGTGNPSFRALVASDIPSHNHDASNITTGTLSSNRLSNHLVGRFTQLGGELATDLGMNGFYDRNILTDVDLTGHVAWNIITGTINGSSTFDSPTFNAGCFNANSEALLFQASSDLEVDLIIDLGYSVSAFSNATWQPFFQKRLPDNRFARFRHINVFVSQNGTNWHQPSAGQWETTTYHDTIPDPPTYWFGGNAAPNSPSTITFWRYVKFEFRDITFGTHGTLFNRIYVSQIGIRHRSEEYARQYLKFRDYQTQIDNWNTAFGWGNHASAGYIPYTGATGDVNLNNRNFENISKTLLNDLTFRRFSTTTAQLSHFRKYIDVKHYANSLDNVSGNLRIEIPVTTSTMWSMEIVLVEYTSTSDNIITTNIKLTGYTLSNLNRSVICDNPNRIQQVRWGRNLAGNRTVLLITPSTSTFRHPKAYIKEVITHFSNETTFYDSANYDITITTDETDFSLNGTITNTEFIRDSYLWNKGDFTLTNISNWNTAFGWGNHLGNYIGIGGITTNSGKANYGGNVNDLRNTLAWCVAGDNRPNNINSGVLSLVPYLYNDYGAALGFRNQNLFYRGLENGVWGPWERLWHSGDFTSTNISNWNTAFSWDSLINAGGVPKASLLLNNTNDLNNIISPGFYYHIGGNPPANRPLGGNAAGYVKVISDLGSFIYQEWIARDSDNRFFRRRDSGGVWSNWRRYWHSGDFSITNYYTKNEALGLFVGLNGVQTINGTKTFTESPVVPNPSLAGHAVNLQTLDDNVGALYELVATVAVPTMIINVRVNTSGGISHTTVLDTTNGAYTLNGLALVNINSTDREIRIRFAQTINPANYHATIATKKYSTSAFQTFHDSSYADSIITLVSSPFNIFGGWSFSVQIIFKP